MIVTLGAELTSEWRQKIARHLGEQAMMLEAADRDQALQILRSTPVSIIVSLMHSLSRERLRLRHYEQMGQAAPGAINVCVAPEPVIEQARTEELFVPDFWLRPAASAVEIGEVLTAALEKAHLVARGAELSDSATAQLAAPHLGGRSTPEPQVLQRWLAGLASDLDTDRLLRTYVETAVEIVHCASYCLLWRSAGGDCFGVYTARGLPAALVAQARLSLSAGLPTWYHHNFRVLSRAELVGWADSDSALALARELDIFHAQVAVPLMVEGQLRGLLMLGEKVVGESYWPAELETAFLLSNYVAVQVQSRELYAQLRSSKQYMERILQQMGSGVISLGPDERIALCNPCAVQILQLSPEETIGADLRCLPAPLGDYLYAAFKSPADVVTDEEITMPGGQIILRVSTSPLADDSGTTLGSVMLLDDISAEVTLATERQRRERSDTLKQLIGRIAHEVKTPLQAIKTYAELVGRQHVEDELSAFWVDTVTPQIDRLDELVNQLVQVVQQPEPHFELVCLETVAQQAVDEVASHDQPEAGVLDLEIDKPVPRVVADPAATRQAIVYLLQYLRGKEGAPLYVSISQDGGEVGGVCVTMQRLTRGGNDIDPEQLFDPFYALQEADGDLGPAVSRQIIDNQGGKILVKYDNEHLEFQLVFPATALDNVRPSEKVT